MSEKKIIEKKTDPKIRFGLLRQDERRILQDLKEKEKQVKIVLAQLQAIRHLLSEVANDLEVDEYEQTLKEEQKERDAKIEQLEEIVGEVKTEVEKEKGAQTLYTGISAEKITIAANENSISRLYELAYTTNDWTDTESKEFFKIRDAVFQVRNYDLAENLSQTVDNVYQAIQVVSNQQENQITQNYKPQYAAQKQFQQQDLPPIATTKLDTESFKNYKTDTPAFKPIEQKFKSNTLDKKLNKKKLDF